MLLCTNLFWPLGRLGYNGDPPFQSLYVTVSGRTGEGRRYSGGSWSEGSCRLFRGKDKCIFSWLKDWQAHRGLVGAAALRRHTPEAPIARWGGRRGGGADCWTGERLAPACPVSIHGLY